MLLVVRNELVLITNSRRWAALLCGSVMCITKHVAIELNSIVCVLVSSTSTCGHRPDPFFEYEATGDPPTSHSLGPLAQDPGLRAILTVIIQLCNEDQTVFGSVEEAMPPWTCARKGLPPRNNVAVAIHA